MQPLASEAPRFVYLIAAYNEAAVIGATVARLESLVQRFPGSCVFLLDNGSVDATWHTMQQVEAQYPWVHAFHEDQKGMGVAYRRGLQEVVSREFVPPLSARDRLVLTAADLPFGFSDLESLLALDPSECESAWLVIGSKAHPHSRAARDFKRRLGSLVFRALRWAVLGLRTADTQGTLLLRADLASQFLPLRSGDFFFAVEIVDRAERFGRVREVPVRLEAEQRPSRVSLLRDGWMMCRQLLEYRRSRQRA